MVSGMSVGQTEVQPAGITHDGDQLLLLTLGLVTSVREHLLLGSHQAVVLDVFRHGEVRDGPAGHGDGLVAQRTYGNLEDIILLLRTGQGQSGQT